LGDVTKNTVEKIQSILKKLETEGNIASVRTEILDLILECLEAKKDTLGDWERTHFSNAIGALGLNIHSVQQPTIAWLRLCLIDLEKAMAPANQRDPKFRSPDPSMRDVTFEQLMGAVDSIGRELG
jgi:hypothetical protein